MNSYTPFKPNVLSNLATAIDCFGLWHDGYMLRLSPVFVSRCPEL